MTEPPAHLGPEFREQFPTWQHLRRFIAERAHSAEYPADRAMHQLVMADLMNQISTGGGDWHLLGSLALPVRPHPADPWPADFQPSARDVHPAYCMPRTAFDLDLFAHHLRERPAADFGREVVAAIHTAAPPPPREPSTGLAGLLRYSANPLHVYDNGQVMGTVNAQPVDDRYTVSDPPPVDDPLIIEIDIKPQSKIQYSSPAEPSHRSVVGLEVPGVHPVRPLLYPLADQLADKIVLLTGPPPPSLRATITEPWHRYKDLVDLYFIIKTCRMDGDMLRQAIANNNWKRWRVTQLPVPYRVYGQEPVPPGEHPVPWPAAIDELRARWPQLEKYPRFSGMVESVRLFAAGLDDPSNRVWLPQQGWSRSVAAGQGPSASALAQQVFRRPPTLAPPAAPRPDVAPRPPAPPHREPGRGRSQS